MTLKDMLIAANLAGGAGGSGGDADVLIFDVHYTDNDPDTGTESGDYWNDATQAPYTFAEFSALYNSGTILIASFEGRLSRVGYDDGSESFYAYGNWYNWDTNEWWNAGVCLDAVNGYWYDSNPFNGGESNGKPLKVALSKQGSPSSLTGDDIFVCDHQFSEIMAAMQDGREVIGVLVQGYAEQRMLPMMNAFADQYSGVTFRDIKFINGGNLGWVMDVLTIQVNNKNNGTHTHSEQYQYSLTSL